MTSVLGLSLAEAEALLRQEGYAVRTQLVRCRKDPEGEAARVVRQTVQSDGSVVLTYAMFRRDPAQQ